VDWKEYNQECQDEYEAMQSRLRHAEKALPYRDYLKTRSRELERFENTEQMLHERWLASGGRSEAELAADPAIIRRRELFQQLDREGQLELLINTAAVKRALERVHSQRPINRTESKDLRRLQRSLELQRPLTEEQEVLLADVRGETRRLL